MLNAPAFEYDLISKYVAIFGSLFCNIEFGRKDEDDNIQVIHVPVTFAQKDKMIARAEGDPEIQRKFAALLPRISFILKNVTYDPSRKLSSTRKTIYPSANTLNSRNTATTY